MIKVVFYITSPQPITSSLQESVRIRDNLKPVVTSFKSKQSPFLLGLFWLFHFFVMIKKERISQLRKVYAFVMTRMVLNMQS